MTDNILADLERAIRSEARRQPEPLCGDRWVVSSAMQKSIRRRDVETAMRAASALWYAERQNFWRRLHTTALEDVGVGAPDSVIKVLAATASPAWRRQFDDMRVGLYLVRLLCESVKNRAADQLYLWLERGTCHRAMQTQLAKASDSLLAAYAEDVEEPLATRAMALWYLAGTQKFTSELIPQRKGSFEEALKVLRSLKDLPDGLVEACISVIGRTQWPLALLTPLIWQEAEKQRSQMQVKTEMLPSLPDVEGIPFFALDMFTRIGQTCFGQLKKAVPELQGYSVRQIGIGIFYSEGGALDKTLTSPFLNELQAAGEKADIENAGMKSHNYAILRDCLTRHAGVLSQIRQEQLHRYLNGANGEKVNPIQGKSTFTLSEVNGGAA